MIERALRRTIRRGRPADKLPLAEVLRAAGLEPEHGVVARVRLVLVFRATVAREHGRMMVKGVTWR